MCYFVRLEIEMINTASNGGISYMALKDNIIYVS